jgi:hypothetical protein
MFPTQAKKNLSLSQTMFPRCVALLRTLSMLVCTFPATTHHLRLVLLLVVVAVALPRIMVVALATKVVVVASICPQPVLPYQTCKRLWPAPTTHPQLVVVFALPALRCSSMSTALMIPLLVAHRETNYSYPPILYESC